MGFPLDRFFIRRIGLIDEYGYQKRNVLFPLLQRGQFKFHAVDPGKKVLAEAACRTSRIFMSCGYELAQCLTVAGETGGLDRKSAFVKLPGKRLQFKGTSCQSVNQKNCVFTAGRVYFEVFHTSLATSTPLVPPKAKEFDMITLTSCPVLPSLGT